MLVGGRPQVLWEGLAGLRDDAPSRRLAARTASGRAAAHGRTKQPGPRDRPRGARNTSGTTSNKTGRQGRQRDLPWRRRVRRTWLRCPWAVAGPGRAIHSDTAPLVWRAPEGPEGTGGLRDRPLRAAGSRVAISRAAGPDGARNTRGATSIKSRKPPPTGTTSSPAQTCVKPRPADAGRGSPTQSGGRV